MSKSLGNLVLVRDLLRIYPGDAIRHYLVSHHYRDGGRLRPADALGRLARLRRACLRAEGLAPAEPARADAAPWPQRSRMPRASSSPPWTTTSTRRAASRARRAGRLALDR